MVGRGAGRQAGMFRTASFRTLLRRFRGQATVAGTQSRPAGASRLRRLHSQQATIGDAAAASAGHRFGLFRRYLKPHVMTVAGLSTAGVGLWYMNKKLPQSENDCVEACVVSSDASSGSGASVSEADWVETCVVSSAEWVAEVDWVETGVVSPVVRNQNDCGSCWAMAAAASVEAMHYLKTFQSILLSVQELVDCDTESKGCQNGHVRTALRYIQENGLSSESDYPYKAESSISGCKRNKIAATSRISGFRLVDPTEDALEKAVAKQPVVVTLQCSDDLFSYYKGGIVYYKAVNGKIDDNHVVLIVGYGTDSNGVKYWRFKNSWGPDWGEEGFGRIRRHVDDERGALGIFMMPGVRPVLED